MEDVFGNPLKPEPPRSLTTTELRQLARSGFEEVAIRFMRPPCGNCGQSESGAFHNYECRWPKAAPAAPIQPWDVKAPKRAA